jgi:hypothetical protein
MQVEWIGESVSFSHFEWLYFTIYRWNATSKVWEVQSAHAMFLPGASINPKNEDLWFYTAPPYKIFQVHLWQNGDWTLVKELKNWS